MDIKITNLSKAYESDIFKNLSLSIKGGQTTALMGKSGCGKTTLFNIICGIVQPDCGKIDIGENCRFSAVFQENRLFETFTGKENLLAVTQDEEKISSSLEICEALDFAHIRVKEMSGGMARRTAIARCIAFDADLYIMDEPFKGIDTAAKDRILLKLKQHLCGKSCIVITHDIKEAVKMADNVIVLGGSPAEVVFQKEISKDPSYDKRLLEEIIKKL